MLVVKEKIFATTTTVLIVHPTLPKCSNTGIRRSLGHGRESVHVKHVARGGVLDVSAHPGLDVSLFLGLTSLLSLLKLRGLLLSRLLRRQCFLYDLLHVRGGLGDVVSLTNDKYTSVSTVGIGDIHLYVEVLLDVMYFLPLVTNYKLMHACVELQLRVGHPGVCGFSVVPL